MILNKENKYNRIITEIEVTEDMKERILDNIDKMDFDLANNKTIKKYKFNYKRYMPIAAVFTILVIGVIMTQNSKNIPNEIGDDPIVSSPLINEYSTLEEMNNDIGLEIKNIEKIPFEVIRETYTSYSYGMGEIGYEGKDNIVYLRKGLGNDDISGYYGESLDIEIYRIANIDITLKSSEGKYVLATWIGNGYSYSIYFTEGVTREEFLEILQDYILDEN